MRDAGAEQPASAHGRSSPAALGAEQAAVTWLGRSGSGAAGRSHDKQPRGRGRCCCSKLEQCLGIVWVTSDFCMDNAWLVYGEWFGYGMGFFWGLSG